MPHRNPLWQLWIFSCLKPDDLLLSWNILITSTTSQYRRCTCGKKLELTTRAKISVNSSVFGKFSFASLTGMQSGSGSNWSYLYRLSAKKIWYLSFDRWPRYDKKNTLTSCHPVRFPKPNFLKIWNTIRDTASYCLTKIP